MILSNCAIAVDLMAFEIEDDIDDFVGKWNWV